MGIIPGNVGYGDTLAAAKRVDVSPTMAIIDPVETPFATFLMQWPNKKRPTINTKFSILTDLYNPLFWTVNGSTSATTVTTFTLDSIGGVFVGMLLAIIKPGDNFPQTEVVRVDALGTGTNVTVDVTRSFRFFTGSTRAVIPDESIFAYAGQVVGDEVALSDLVSNIARVQDQVEVVNYTELIFDVLAISDTEAKVKHYATEDYREWKRRLMMSNVKMRMERSLLFGVPGTEAAPAGLPGQDFTNGGFYYWLRRVAGDNAIYDYPGAAGTYKQATAITQATFLDWLSEGFLHGSDQKLLFVGPLGGQAIDSWNLTAVRSAPGSEFFGVRTKVYASSHGEVRIIRHKMLRNPPMSTLAATNKVGLGGMMFLIDPEDVGMVHLNDKDFTMETDVGVPGDEVKKDKVSGTFGLELHNPSRHGVWEGLKTYSA